MDDRYRQVYASERGRAKGCWLWQGLTLEGSWSPEKEEGLTKRSRLGGGEAEELAGWDCIELPASLFTCDPPLPLLSGSHLALS